MYLELFSKLLCIRCGHNPSSFCSRVRGHNRDSSRLSGRGRGGSCGSWRRWGCSLSYGGRRGRRSGTSIGGCCSCLGFIHLLGSLSKNGDGGSNCSHLHCPLNLSEQVPWTPVAPMHYACMNALRQFNRCSLWKGRQISSRCLMQSHSCLPHSSFNAGTPMHVRCEIHEIYRQIFNEILLENCLNYIDTLA